MADLSDVSAALRALVSLALYPPAQFPSGPSGNSVAGMPVLVQSGWPDPASLSKQIGESRAQVTVYPQPTERNTTRYPQAWAQTGALQPVTFTLAVSGQVVTVGGAQPSPFYGQNFAVFVNGKAYLYRSVLGDTLGGIATALAAKIAVDFPGTTASGTAITLPAGARVGALRVGTQAAVASEIKRQERMFSIIVWAPSPATRDQIAKFIDVAIAQNRFLSLDDGSQARLIYKGSPFSDFDQKQGIYRRDFSVQVEYATLASDMAAEAIAIETIYSQEAPNGAAITPPIQTTYT